MNPYETLGIKITATKDEIKTAYKNLAKKYHPDICKEKNAVEMMKKINNAYDILMKPQPQRIPMQRQEVVIVYGYGTYGGSGSSTGWW